MNDSIARNNKCILYLRPGGSSIPLNRLTADLLKREFPEYRVQVADVRDLVKRAKFTSLANMLVTIWVYRKDLLLGRKTFRRCFWRTAFLFRRIRRLIYNSFGNTNWTFTFQIQSLFDCSIDGIPHFVYTDHTHLANLSYPDFDPSSLFHRSWIHCERGIYRNAAAVFTMSTNMRSSMIADYDVDPGRVFCVYSGPNIQIDDEINRTHEILPLAILFVGVDWHRKGGDLLLDAYSRIRADFPQTEIVVVGCENPDSGANPEGVRFVGRVPLDQVGQYFHRASIFCMPTRLEPFGIVFIEAMAYSLPIVATRIGAIPDLVNDGDSGLLIESEDVDGLADALRQLLSDSNKRQQMGRNGRQKYLNQFNWAAVYAKMRQQMTTQVRLSSEARIE